MAAPPDELVRGLGVTGSRPVAGGDISHAARVDTPRGPLFVKWHPDPRPGMFEREAAGLRALRSSGAIAGARGAARVTERPGDGVGRGRVPHGAE